MKYLLINDTSHTHNPGCRGTVACLRELLRREGMVELRSLRVGYGQEYFEFGLEAKFGSRQQRKWEDAKKRLNSDFGIRLAGCDLVVVNAEGTIHHNQPAALAILAAIDIANDKGVPIIFLNGTVHAMCESLLKSVLIKCAVVSVREPESSNYLHSLGIDHALVPDCLFTLNTYFDRPPNNEATEKSCIYTPGVLTYADKICASDIRDQFKALRNAQYSISYLVVEKEDEKLVSAARKEGAKIIGIADVPWYSMADYLANHSLVVSGRYHILIYSWLASVPIVSLPSNSWKIEGLLDLVGCPGRPASDSIEFVNSIRAGGCLVPRDKLKELKALSEIGFADLFQHASTKIRSNLEVGGSAHFAKSAFAKHSSKLIRWFRGI